MAGAIGSIVGGIFQSNAASDAQSAQERAAARARRDQNRAFERQVQLQAPFRQGGLTALSRYMTLFGLEPPTVYAGGRLKPPSDDKNRPPELYVDPNDPDFGKYARDFSMADFEADPGYAFRMKEGLKALEGRAASRGGLLSGNTLRGITDYGQDAASQEYLNAFNRYQINRRNQLAPLESLTGMARSSSDTLSTAAGNLGNALASNSYQLGNVQAAGEIARGNAMSGMVGGITDALGGFNYGRFGGFGSGTSQYSQGFK